MRTISPRAFAPGGLRVFSILFAFDSVVISVAMPMMLNYHNFFVMISVPVAVTVVVTVAIAITLYDNRVLGIRRSVRKSDRRNTKSNNS
jgi:hypothetical protein